MEFSNITGFIFAAGLGTRLRPITLTTPKPLVKVHGKPILEYNLDLMLSLGIKDVVINAFHLKEQFKPYEGTYKGRLNVKVSYENIILGHGGGLVNALPFINHDFILAINGDTILTFQKEALMTPFKRISSSSNKLDLEIAVMNDSVTPLAIQDGILIGIGNKKYIETKNEKNVKRYNALGLYLMKKTTLELIKPEDGFMGIFGEDDLIDRLYEHKSVAKTFEINDYKRYEITTPEDLEKINSQNI